LGSQSAPGYVYGVSRRHNISDYANSLLGMPLGKFFSFRICWQMYNIASSGKLGYLYDSIQFGRSRRLGGIIIPRHNYATTAASFFVRGAILWNDLPMLVREELGVGKFREKCRSFMEQTAISTFKTSLLPH
jgi:hypothetical protein